MSNIINIKYPNDIYFTHPTPFFNYSKSLVFSKETNYTIIYKLRNIIQTIDNGVNGYMTSNTLAFNSLYEYNELKNIVMSNQSDADKIICLKLFFTTLY
jgi:hypothetical protein